jgi:hypothetical protein
MLNRELSSESGYSLIGEMCTLVTSQSPRTLKPHNDHILKNEPCCCICREIPNRLFFIPVSEIVYSSNDIPCL